MVLYDLSASIQAMEILINSGQFISSASAVGQLVEHSCLFGVSDVTLCSYNPFNPSIYFSLGDAIAGGGLLLAASQLISASGKIILRIRPWWQRFAHWLLAAIGFVLILFASIIPQLPITNHTPAFYPVTYEILGALFFAASPMALLFFAKPRRDLFNDDNAARFEHAIMVETARSTEETLQAIVHIIFLNLEKILKIAEEQPTVRNRESDQLEPSDYANNIIVTVFSNQKFVDYICTSRRDFLHVYLYLIKTRAAGSHLEFPFHVITKTLFSNTDSYLYIQHESRHLLGEHSLYKNIFYEQNALSMNPFRDWIYTRSDENSDYLNYQFLEIYLAALQTAVDGYLNSGILNASNAIISGFRNIISSPGPSYCQSLLHKTSDSGLHEIIRSRLVHVEYFLGSTLFYKFYDAYSQKKIKDSYLDTLNLGMDLDDVIVAYVKAMYEYIEIVAGISRRLPEYARDYAVGITTNFFIGGSENHFSKKVFDLFTGYVWSKIEENVERGSYPNVLGLYISMIGLRVTDDPGCRLNKERNKLIEFMDFRLAPKILADSLMMNGTERMEDVFLPKEVIFNRDTNKFEYHTPHTIQIMEKV